MTFWTSLLTYNFDDFQLTLKVINHNLQEKTESQSLWGEKKFHKMQVSMVNNTRQL